MKVNFPALARYMKRIIALLSIAGLTLVLTGCLSAVRNEVPLAGNDLSVRATKTNETKLVFFNASNFALYGLDGSGRINVKLDGKGVVLLHIGEYAQVITTMGHHEIDLVHLDLAYMRSHHSIELNSSESFLRIFATPTAHEVDLIPVIPPNFEKDFKPVEL